MANQTDTNYNSFEMNPGDASSGLNLSYTEREYQSSIVIEQDPRKEGILSFFENMNYNLINESQTPQSTPTATGQSNAGSSNQSTGMY